ncbi:hypothetical protein VCHA53O466_50249 [Vibrio chagasii]|nr:hypothetical protein VCHA53O466_50249 [Vibrio chagasii]
MPKSVIVKKNMKNLISPEESHRDEDGAWTHSEFPDFGEWVDQKTLDDWATEQEFTVVIKMLDGDDCVPEEIADRFFDMSEPYIGFAFWEPSLPADGAFLLSIHDTEDGPCAWFAIPDEHRGDQI